MDVQPASITIPPLESRFATLCFCPRAIQTYVATFEAAVEGGRDPRTRALTFEVRGEGTLPSLTLQVGYQGSWGLAWNCRCLC